MNRTKQDKKFMIQFDLANRNSLSNISMFMLSILLSVTALFVSVVAVIIALHGIDIYTIISTIVFMVLLIPFWIKYTRQAKKTVNYAKKINEQLQSNLFEIYPEYKKKFH